MHETDVTSTNYLQGPSKKVLGQQWFSLKGNGFSKAAKNQANCIQWFDLSKAPSKLSPEGLKIVR